MQKGLIRKGLVYCVIVLFISVGVQPVFAEESITSTLDKDEDCIECGVSDGFSLLRAKILLFRVKIVTNVILSSKLGEIPEIKEDCQNILDILNVPIPGISRLSTYFKNHGKIAKSINSSDVTSRFKSQRLNNLMHNIKRKTPDRRIFIIVLNLFFIAS